MTKIHIVELAALIQTEHESDVLGRLMATGMQPVKRKQALTVNAKLAVFLFLVCAGVLSLLQSLKVITVTQQGLRFASPPAYVLVTPMALNHPEYNLQLFDLRRITSIVE